MTSLSSLLSQPTRLSPKERVQQELQTEATSGVISSGDQSALSSALDDISSSLEAGKSSSATGRPDPSKIKEKIASLIEDQVNSGKLTQDQAKELATVFDTVAAKAKGHHHHAGGPPPGGHPPGGPPPSGSGDSTSSGFSSGSSSIGDLISSFLSQLQASNQTSYAANGSTTSSSNSLLLDFSV